jgi:hypothetical protein
VQEPGEFQGSFSAGVQRDHDGHVQMGSFGENDCPMCHQILSAHAEHEQTVQGSFSEGVRRDEEGYLLTGSFGVNDCPICRANADAATAGS